MPIKKYLEKPKAKAKHLSSDLFINMQKDIILGKLKPGSKLSEQKLCERYNVSRTPVRECLKQLETEGLIRVIPNRGAFVVGITKQDIEDMIIIKGTLEVQTVKWAVSRIAPEEFEALRQAIEFINFYTGTNDIAKIEETYIAFRRIIYDASHNYMLTQQLQNYLSYASYVESLSHYTREMFEEATSEHNDIFAAFVNKDPEAGKTAIINNLRGYQIRRKNKQGYEQGN